MNLKKNEYSQKSKQSEIDKLQSATQNTEVRSEIDGVIQKIDTSKMLAPSFLMIIIGVGEFAYKREDGIFIVPIGCLKD